jgi:type I restriction enzyme S subunit
VSEWPEIELGEVARLSWGDTSTTKGSYTRSGWVAYSASGPDGLLPYFDHEVEAVVISAIGAQCGKTWLARGRWSSIKNTMWMQAVPSLAHTGFLYHATRLPDFWPRRGAAQPFISLGDAKRTVVSLPPPKAQRRIAAVLSAFDELIESNKRRVVLLEHLARSLYQEWFLHFRFPGHDEVDVVDSVLGPIPEGWEVRAVGEIAKLHRRPVKPAMEAEAAFELFSIPAFDRWGVPELERGGAIRSGKQAIDGECVLLSKLNPRIKRVWFAVPSTQRGVSSTEFLVWIGVEASNAWLWAMFSGDAFQRWLLGVSGGTSTSHQRVKPQDVEAHVLPFAPPELREAFDRLATPALRQVVALRRRNRTLAATRDLLLPRLVTGRLDISDIDLGDLLPADAA